MALTLSGISHTFGAGTSFSLQALVDVDLTIQAGRLTVVLGPTGSGKSTLLGIGSGLLSATAGVVKLDGVVADGVLAGRSSGVGLVFQSPENQLFAETVLDDVAFGPSNLGLDRAQARERARDALLAVDVDPDVFGARSPFALSGGEARRVALAGVLAMQPSYLLLDEPTAGLDAQGREAVLRALDRLMPSTGVAIVTHDAEEFLGRADDVLLLTEGRSVYCGPVEGLLRKPTLLEEAGLVVPDVVTVLHAARSAGIAVGLETADPAGAAVLLARALGSVNQ